MPDRKSSDSLRSQLRSALARWENEGGAGPGREVDSAVVCDPPLTNAELVQLQIRVIALESVITALLAEASEPQIERACERALYIVPRPGHTPHRLTIGAAARIVSIIEDAARFRELPASVRAGSTRVQARPDGAESS
ncbi:MAG: hypothetical protein ACXWUL_09265 [Caldimonas sp.]